MRPFLLLILTSLILIACGTKGPLYIPEQRYPQDSGEPKREPVYKPAQPTESDF